MRIYWDSMEKFCPFGHNLINKEKDWEVLQMNKPVLVVLAAGMGSRYRGLKQIDPVGT